MAKTKARRKAAPKTRKPQLEIDDDLLVDFFAGCALIGIVMRTGIPNFSVDNYDQIAEAAYEFGDAMLRVRNDEEDEDEEDRP